MDEWLKSTQMSEKIAMDLHQRFWVIASPLIVVSTIREAVQPGNGGTAEMLGPTVYMS